MKKKMTFSKKSDPKDGTRADMLEDMKKRKLKPKAKSTKGR